ncbi:hypothetical protein BIW11_07976 [Tropilaelaps mercedesae]|uniref:Uncharacterized protein n=1 Tax=Tropilaelaps mercedesae TaxID=418985 RepID=A0A1V9XRL0_9ACAR|nr:hypothetical protein BIW11_07976 [Tropilaelaps mercedesae]
MEDKGRPVAAYRGSVIVSYSLRGIPMPRRPQRPLVGMLSSY